MLIYFIVHISRRQIVDMATDKTREIVFEFSLVAPILSIKQASTEDIHVIFSVSHILIGEQNG